MPELLSILDRLEKRKVNKFGDTVHTTFDKWVKKIKVPTRSHALSISTGNGVWDYEVLKLQPKINTVVATDIVDNAVSIADQELLNTLGKWSFRKVEAEQPLPPFDSRFELIYHLDVIEHVKKPFTFLQDQYKQLNKGGYLIIGTPNLHRPANIAKLLSGKLQFPATMGEEGKLGDCIHIQEFDKDHLQTMLKEVGYKIIDHKACFFGLCPVNIQFSDFPKSALGQSLCQYLMFLCQKP